MAGICAPQSAAMVCHGEMHIIATARLCANALACPCAPRSTFAKGIVCASTTATRRG